MSASEDPRQRGTRVPPARTRTRGSRPNRRDGHAPSAPADTRTESAGDEPRIVEERSVVGPYGEEEREVVDELGRRFWTFRPVPAQRYDIYGVGWFWWLIFWAVIIGLIVWGWGWGWGY